jgi:hypothetical protein
MRRTGGGPWRGQRQTFAQEVRQGSEAAASPELC